MAKTHKILGQNALPTSSETTVYTVPDSTSAVISSILVTNRNASTTVKYKLAIRPSADGSTSNEHYIRFNKLLDIESTHSVKDGITLQAGDKILAEANGMDVSVSVFGVEITA